MDNLNIQQNNETKENQETLYNPSNTREINTINLEHNEPLVEHTLGQSHSTLSSSKSESISDPGSITTTKLFTKPIVFAPNLEWTVDQTVNTTIYSGTLIGIFETLTRSPGGQSLKAHTFFRSGAVIQCKLTSSPFHSGKLILHYIPPGVDNQFRDSVYAKVQYPCVYLDAGNSTTGELNIPFVTIKDFFATYNPDGMSDFGRIAVTVLNPLGIGTGGPTTVNFALSLHPTTNQIALPVLAHDIDIQAGIVLGALGDVLAGAAQTVGLTALGVGAEKGVESLLGTNQHSLDSKTLNSLDKIVNKNNTTSTKDLNISAPSLSNMMGLGTEHLSLFPEKTFVTNPMHHSPEDDEMDLLRVAQIPSIIQIKDWADTDAPSTVLFKANIDPMTVPISATGPQTIVYPTYLSYVTSPFAYWRGSIDYHFTFAATEQHKGKVIAAWIPYDYSRDNISAILREPDVESLSLFPNEIFDLSLNREFEFSVPYNTETPYRIVRDGFDRLSPNAVIVDNSNQRSSLGTIILMVYNRLSHPNTVASTIQFNTYIKAGRDYQMRALRYTPPNSSYQTVNYVSIQGLDIEMETSREGMTKMAPNRVALSDTTVSPTTFQDDSSEHNLCYLLSKYYPQVGLRMNVDTQTTQRVTIANLPGLSVRSPRATGSPMTNDPIWRNLINYFRDIYAFWHGSLNYFFIHDSTVNTPVFVTLSHNPTEAASQSTFIPSAAQYQQTRTIGNFYTLSTVTSNVDLSETCIYSHISNLRVNPTIEVTAPYRSIYRRLYTYQNSASDTSFPDLTSSAGALDLIYSNPTAAAIPLSLVIFQSVGSDFRFKYIIPPPSVLTTY